MTDWTDRAAPTTAEIESLAREVLAGLPVEFAGHAQDVILRVEEFAGEEVLDELELIVGTSDAVFESDVPQAASVEAAATAATAASERDVVRLVRLVIMLRCRRSRHWAHAHAAVAAGRG